jgi:16S rRNA (adenine1518-N6/adenine1519-N6)-dimethyltransferase
MLKPNKRLGQHFLSSKRIVNDIIKTAGLKKSGVVLEVGPGKGVLTEALLKTRAHTIAVEKDKELIRHLGIQFPSEINTGKLKLIHADILKFKPESCKLKAKSYSIVANIPYYITSRFLRRFLEFDKQPSKMVLMLQKEVAQRIAATGGKESILSISVKAYGAPKIIKTVPAKCFSPAPKVDSALLLISKISKDFFVKNKINEKSFFSLVKKGFANKRKLLKNNLKLPNARPLTECGISEQARAENLSLENWLCLAKSL